MLFATLFAIAAGFGAETAAPVAARVEQAAPAPRSSRQLYVCTKDDASRRAFKREHGEVIFVSAREVVDSRTDGAAWSAPRCITPTEYQRLERMVGEMRWVDETGR